MTNSIKVQMKLFGAFRNLCPSGAIELTLSQQSSVSDVKAELEREFGRLSSSFDFRALLERSVLADEKQILKDADGIGDRRVLAVLPPVCGG